MRYPVLLFLVAAIGWSGCSNDFDVAAPWKDIPVVYGLLDLTEPVHSIRVEKAFLDPDANALDLAQVADSLYYAAITVQLEKNGNGQRYSLQRVDGNQADLPRDQGIFADEPNWLYQIDSGELRLRAGDEVRLYLERKDGLPTVTADATVLGAGKLRTPNPTLANNFNFEYTTDSKITWSADDNARIFDVVLLFKYAEIENGQVSEHQLEWVWARNLQNQGGSAELVVARKGIEFYEYLQGNIPVKEDVIRVFQGIDVMITAGGESLEKYVNVARANTGITGSQDIPTYTNLSEGRGVFSSVSRLVSQNVQLTQRTRDSLANGIITRQLNF
ncbi:MAG: hypothetical protein RLY31_1460 [Bacteroidota bacterium]|jgi:hypothetical protein